ncbi:MAG: terpene cyclase/mutase family protein [Planctomycetes bacterium]|nr:terpene cyclase/mutase family protein [Planctomycetota bacterium]
MSKYIGKRWLAGVVLMGAVALDRPSGAHSAQDPHGPQSWSPAVYARNFDAEVRRACDRGLAWLASQQQSNGAWRCKIAYKLYETYEGEDGDDVGVTAIACMAFVGAGHVPGRGRYGRVVERGLNFILSCVREEDGYITAHGTRMYSHAFATMFLAEIYGMTRRSDVKEKLRRAIDLIVSAQNKEGGWRYQPIPVDADLSVTVSTLQALRAARNAGLVIPLDTIDRAMRYVKGCATRYGFTYQLVNDYAFNDTRISYALTACGVVAHMSAGIYDSREIRDGLRFLEERLRDLRWGKYHYFYGHYYAAQAMYMAGEHYWENYYPRVKAEIVRGQREDGAWTDDVGLTYATAMAVVVLQMPCEWLPIFQK